MASPLILGCLGASLAGSVPFGLLVMRLAGKGDVRAQGSGNIGATNVLRSGGKGLGIATLLLDVAKGLLPVLLARRAGLGPEALAWVALAAVAGHMFTPWLRFKGGKGVATALGAVLAFHPALVVPALAVFLAAVLVWRYVSLGSVLAAAALFLTALGLAGAWAMPAPARGPAAAAWALLAALVIFKHRANLKRLAAGTESRLWGAE
ncbi:MAG: glycerol-3-phosphate 1-O-acyltransferase PlsY [Holophaga sp.]|jgi:glycerol-3-phosphate acyltransferase PlsY